MRVIVDRDKCCGAGQCVMIAPKVFDQQADGIVVLLDDAPPEALSTRVREAAAVCPTGAIKVVEGG